MLPSRGPVRVTLEATSSTAVQCKPPAQVKILRRPKPVADIDKSDLAKKSMITSVIGKSKSNLNHSIKDSHCDTIKSVLKKDNKSINVKDAFEERLLCDPEDGLICKKNFGDAASVLPETKLVITKSNVKQSHNYQLPHTSSTSHRNNQLDQYHPAHNNNEKSYNKNKKSIKTYQERADEYAKARLRILGSAFPENDDCSTITDDVSRILNLEFYASSSNGLSDERKSNGATDNLSKTGNVNDDTRNRDDSNFREDNHRCYSSRAPES